jgi:cardiolipin synthase
MLNDITWSVIILFLLEWALRIAFLLYIPRKRKPSSAIAWLLVIFLIPGIGIVLFLVIGSPKLSKRRRHLQDQIDATIAGITADYENETADLSPAQKERYLPIINLADSLTKLPAVAGNSIAILPEYNEAIDDLVAAINKAKEFVHMEYFALVLDDITTPLFEAFEAAVKRGVKVRLMFDALGSRGYPRKKEMEQRLTDIGVDWRKMLPIRFNLTYYNRPDLRNHRKITIIDDHTAYIGSQNLVDRTYHRKDDIHYDELVAKMTGPVVRECSGVFASDWFTEAGEHLPTYTDPKLRPLPAKTGKSLVQIVPSGPNYATENNARLFTSLIHHARTKLVITNPYFVPNESILEAITSATRRGVDVTIINSEAMDQWMVGHAQRSFYKELLEAGVKIHLNPAPTLLHSKHMTIDDDITVVGSSNMDIRSFELDLECIMIAYDPAVVTALGKVQSYNLKQAKALDLKTWTERHARDELLDSIARLTSSLQ